MTTHSDCCFQPTQISHARSPHTLEIASISHQRIVKPQGYDLLEMCSSSKVNLLTSGSRSQTVKLFTPESPGWQRLHGTFVPFNRVCCTWAVTYTIFAEPCLNKFDTGDSTTSTDNLCQHIIAIKV